MTDLKNVTQKTWRIIAGQDARGLYFNDLIANNIAIGVDIIVIKNDWFMLLMLLLKILFKIIR
jgi:hypothetical protein